MDIGNNATVIWLSSFGLSIKCLQLKLFVDNDNTYMSVEQIIPIPESEEFVIKVTEKAKEDRSISKNQEETDNMRIEFWSRLLKKYEYRNSFV